MNRLSKPQEAIYYMSRFSEDSIANIAGDVFFDFHISLEEAREAILSFLDRCEIMHIRFVNIDGELVQKIERTDSYSDIPVRRFNNYNEYEDWANAEAIKPLKITERLYRIYLIDIAGKIGLYCVVHHLISDASSFAFIGKYIGRYIKGEKDISIYSYDEYLLSEEKYEKTKRYEKDKDYWIDEYKKHTINYFNEKEINNKKAARRSLAYSKDLSCKIVKFCTKFGVSEYALFFSVIAAYYFKITQKNEFFIGTPVLNRYSIREENMLGVFVNTVPIGFSIDDFSNFADFCLSTSDKILTAFRHQKYHYTQLLKDAAMFYGSSERMFDVILSFWNVKTLNDSTANWFCNCSQVESLQIHIDDRRSEGFYHVNYDYQTEKFSEHDIDMLHEHICALLSDALENENKKLCELEFLTSAEKQKLLYEFNDTAVDYPRDKCVHELFEEQATKTPDETAIIACDKTLTYKELNEEANRIAHSLIEKGIGKGDIVAFKLARRSYLLLTMLGILKTGAAYLPIDLDYPSERIGYMLSDSDAKYCVTEENISELLNNSNIQKPEVSADSTDICYCIYTSGSTGKPKGALLSHRNVVNYISANEKNVCFGITGKESKSMLSVTTVGFDIFVTESLLPLANGMKIILADEEQAKLQSKLIELLAKYPADILQTTPTKMKSLIADKTQLDYLKGLKTIILGGESLDSSLVKELKQISEGEVFNIYGPTETTVWVTNAEIKDEEVHIGKPMANTQIYIVDKYMKLVPVGVTGELCIAGDCVGAGYLNRPEFTAEKFIDNPFGEGKLYKTGDLAYWREDGNIVFCGRNDFQVKIRGLRIELGEIENAISNVEGIIHSVVVVREDKEGRQLICAFYTGTEIEAKTFRTILSAKLPKYMVPHIFTHLEEMPLTASGKISRNTLPEIELENISTDTEYVAPETENERILAECVQDVLGVEKISMLENFFDVGGDSLKAIELTAKLEAKGYDVPVKTIFSAGNVQELARYLEVKEAEYVKREYGSVIPATPAQMRVYTAQMLSPESTLYNVTYAFKTESVNLERLQKAVNMLIERHESLRTHFENRDGVICQVTDESAAIKVETIEEKNLNSFAKAFDLSKSPLMRVGCSKDTVIIDMHHSVVDGETMPIIFRELNELYMGRDITQEAVQYGEFAVQQRNAEESENYWLDMFKEEVPALELPTDYQRGTVQSFNGNIHYSLIEKSQHERIEEKCRQRGITPYVYYMACFSILLSKISGNEDIVAGTPISGRTSRFLDTVGMFVNTIALRSRPEGDKTVIQLMEEIKEASISAIDNQNYPFGELVKKLGIEVGGRNPLYDVMLAYQSYEMTDITFGDKKVELLPLTTSAAKCDMTFTVLPRKDDVVLATEYCIDLYKEERIERFVSLYTHILELCLDDNSLIKDISAIDKSETNKLLYEFNDTAHTYTVPEGSTIYSLFEKTAKENPHKTCITTSEKTVTFGELLRLSEKLDAEIRNIIGDKKSVIGVIAERSVEMYTAVYGIIRGGNAYLPIDPEYPKERIEYILENSEAAAVVTQGKFVNLVGNTPCIDMTTLIEGSTKSAVSVPATVAEENDTAYVIYTSGSTGNPKGAKVSHKSAVNRILWMHDKYPLEENSVILQKTPYTFDVSVWELFWWGICAGSLAASKPGEHFLPAKILDETYSNKVTHLHFVPSVFELFLNYLEKHKDELYKFDSVKYVFLSGEALSASLVQRFYNLFSYERVTLHNLYGPTECAVDVTYYDCTPYDIDPVPIGKPIYNTQMYVVDKFMNLQPVGIRGELCIAGANVGHGYLNNPDLTAEKFIDNPFGEGKLYKTGDLAYWREDGNIVFAGRIDSQIKLGGQRIEIGEIESVISGTDAVESVAVVVNKTGTMDMLVAFYSGKIGSETLIKDVCTRRLPKYMIPSAVVHLDKLPLNQSGKLDRKALLKMEVALDDTDTNEEPVTEDEKMVCELFKKHLKVEKVGRNSDFFTIGGSSLSMISVLSEDVFKDVKPAEFMANPTPRELAELLKNKEKSQFEYLEVLFESQNAKKAMVLFPFAGGGAEAYTNFVNSMKSSSSGMSIYFVRYLHSSNECEEVAKEISDILKDKDIYFYSHCVGSAVAMQIMNIIEVPVKHYIAGASIPPQKSSRKNIWNIVPDRKLKAILKKAGAPLDLITDDKVSEMLKQFRKDTDFAVEYFSRRDSIIEFPVSVVISKKDVFTRNYRRAEKIWQSYVHNLKGIHYIESSSHYFQSDSSDELVKIINSIIE